jgi:hypothetical protein
MGFTIFFLNWEIKTYMGNEGNVTNQ